METQSKESSCQKQHDIILNTNIIGHSSGSNSVVESNIQSQSTIDPGSFKIGNKNMVSTISKCQDKRPITSRYDSSESKKSSSSGYDIANYKAGIERSSEGILSGGISGVSNIGRTKSSLTDNIYRYDEGKAIKNSILSISSTHSIKSINSSEVDIAILELPFTIEKYISENRISWILKGIQARKMSREKREICKKIVNYDGSEILYDVLIVNPVDELLEKFPTALLIDESIKTVNCTNTYEIFGTKMYHSICHGKYYIIFKKEKIMFSLNLSRVDEIQIIKSLDIKYVVTSDGHIYNALERYIDGLLDGR